MGDRGNVILAGGENFPHPVALYTHWGGSKIAKDVAEIIAKRERWDDSAYLGRRIASKIFRGDDGLGETGYGISAGVLLDNEYPVVVVDFSRQAVFILRESDVESFPGNFLLQRKSLDNLRDDFTPVATFEEIAERPERLHEIFEAAR